LRGVKTGIGEDYEEELPAKKLQKKPKKKIKD
jgi:hypothetical protein